ncbi:MAG: hypothetical protein NC401_19565 [Ruminococcus sp.]|nr:hypothetical protein [Ruminococcus sp.]
MENKYRELFEKLAPQKSDEELLQAVLNGKAVNMSEKKRFNKKAVIIPAAAAAVLAVTTVGVSAAYEWNLPAAVSDIFGRNSEKIPDGVTFKEFNFNTIGGKELDDVLEFDGCEVRFKGVSADSHNMFLFFDVVMDDPDFKLADNEEMNVLLGIKGGFNLKYYTHEGAAGTADDPAMFSMEEMTKKIGAGIQERKIFLGSEGNVVHFCYKALFEGYSYSGENITIEIGTPGKSAKGECDYESFFNSERKEYEISLDFVDDKDSLDLFAETEIVLSTGETGTVTHIQLTPLSLCFRVGWGNTPLEWKWTTETPDPSALDALQIYNEIKIKLKDGTIMDKSSFLPFEDEGRASFRNTKYVRDDGTETCEYFQDPGLEWLYPVNVSDVEALIIGETTIPINQ